MSRRPFIGLLAAEGVSLLGTRMSTVALPWFVLVSTGSAARTGLVAFSEMLPYVVVMATAGPFLDRYGARRLSLGCDLVAAVFVGAVPIVYSLGLLRFEVLLALVAGLGSARSVADSAKRVLVPRLIEDCGVPVERGTGLHDAVNRVASLVGAPLAGVLVAVFSAPLVLAVDAATFVLAAVLLAWVGAVRVTPVEVSASYLTRLRDGLAWIRRDRLLCGIAAMVCVTNLLDQALFAVLLPLWAHDNGDSAFTLGVLFGALAGGAVLGNAAAAWIGPRLPRHRTYAWGFVLVGAPRFAVLALTHNVPVVLTVILVSGLGSGVINPILSAVEYERIPQPLQARVLGSVAALAWAGIPVGALVGGAIAGGWGLRPALVVAGLGYFLTTLAPFVFPSWRGMNRAAAGIRPEVERVRVP